LGARIKQHGYDCQEKYRAKSEKTALAQHHFETGHDFNFSDVKILDREQGYRKRCISEMIHIYITDNINLRSDVDNLSHIYSNLLKKASKIVPLAPH